LLFEDNLKGTVYNLLASRFSNKHTFQVFDKILSRVGNKNNILNKKKIVKDDKEYSEENILSVYLREFLNCGETYKSIYFSLNTFLEFTTRNVRKRLMNGKKITRKRIILIDIVGDIFRFLQSNYKLSCIIIILD